MIAFPQSLPLVAWHHRRNIPLSEGWLSESLRLSAWRAGERDWAHSDEVARAIMYFLRHDHSGSVISPGELKELMRRSLEGIGCREMARHVGLVAPRVSIHLLELARISGIELVFFQHLSERLREALEVVVQGIRLEDLRGCVKLLDGSRKWDAGCARLGEEIVYFSRRQLAAAGQPQVELAVF